MSPRLLIGIDVGGTNISVAAFADAGRVVGRQQSPTPARLGDAALDALAALVRAAAGGVTPAAVGIGLPGLIDRAAGRLREAPNLPGWSGAPLREPLARRLGAPVFLENDANCAALGEWWLGAGRGVDDLVLFTLGTGVGGGIVSGGRLLTGCAGLAGEIGHVSVQQDGETCNCGNRGCLETVASASAVARRAVVRLGAGEGAGGVLARLAASGEPVTSALVFRAANEGDGLAREILAEAGRWLGMAAASLVNVLNPRRLILGGGLSGAFAFLEPPLAEELARRVMPSLREGLEVRRALLGREAGCSGAARAALEAAGGVLPAGAA